MPCDFNTTAVQEQRRLRMLQELDARIVASTASIVRSYDGALAIEGMGDIDGMRDSCVLAWLAAHGSYEARLALQAAGADMNELAAVHAAGG